MDEDVERSEAQVLPGTSLISAKNVIATPHNQFTHELIRSLQFNYGDEIGSAKPFGGVLETATKFVLIVDDGERHCWVAGDRGFYVQVEYEILRKL
ncbi:hypothetical protein MCBMB27_04208 [Methylobacterium phyllosphaerae]|uniref:Uncharacterized protein n=1 Tax=Methylobacterium phyllosphaerae TaxID=418223 RepID=A0AAE8L9G9_9HYPH|nr:hypothetical protein [Methylobacterium phyllosphaerae]APT33499.1 hypothetical protein MCBMB27_04208 [Methylobacterium phyllosphaerae]SFH64442.1 hypothetical protein SAMN05192567_13911 [Methylobacterium phyllosphaerae]